MNRGDSHILLTNRALGWASTMEGIRGARDGVRLAHAGAASLGPTAVFGREEREQFEDAFLASGASRSKGAGTRSLAEEPDELRTCFERDRDRILHSAAFRRLAGKTQVFVFPADHQRTRLTHALEVAQVATAIASALRLNVALCEAIALGHDCGHGPGGHASEDALSPFVEGGFDHAVWGADVTALPLNLCAETLDGIRNHSWSRPAPSTPEGEVVALADRIAYTAHDLEDAARCAVVDLAELPEVVAERCGRTRSSQLRAFIEDTVKVSSCTGRVALSDEMGGALSELRLFNYERIYLRPASLDQSERVVKMLRSLVEHYAAHPAEMRSEGGGSMVHLGSGSPGALRHAVGYVAGMTDRFACTQAAARLGWAADRLPRGSGSL